MTIAEGSRSTIVEGTLRGCDLALVHLHPLAPGGAACLLQLDLGAQTYTRSLTGAELAALARLNPDDGMPDALLPLMCDLALAVTVLVGGWQMLTYSRIGAQRPEYAATIRPLVGEELSTLARLAGELLAAIGVS
jgi:hypothetical protein